MSFAKRAAMAATVIGLAVPATANAAVTVDIANVGSNVVATLSGTLNTTGLTANNVYTLDVAINSVPGYIGTGVQDAFVTGYSGFSGPGSFGASGPFVYASSSTGTNFAFNAGSFGSPFVFLDSGFVSGSAITSSATFNNASIASFGLAAGQYVFTSGADTITFNISGAGAVPEPAAWALMIGGFGLVGAARRARVRKINFA